MLNSKKINIGISIGDPNGIGIEIILKVLSESYLYGECNFIIYSSLDLITKQQDFFKIKTLPLKKINSLDEIVSDHINIKEVFSSSKFEFGKNDKEISANGVISFKEAVKDAKSKKIYIKNFKRHLALNIASMMQGYSGQKYKIFESKIDSKNKVTLVDMEIFSETGSLIVTWRVKKSKDRFFVIDLIVADISLVVTKRSEFNSMLKSIDYKLVEFNKILEEQNKESYIKIIN